MTKIIKQLFYAGSICAALAFTACSNVDEAERYLEYPLPEASKNILIMEFTGQGCSNCPDGAKVIHGLQEQYPENVIAVCLHPEGTEFTDPKKPVPAGGLTSQTATDVYRFFKTPVMFPYAIFDGQIDAEVANNSMMWSQKAISMLNNPSPFEIKVTASANQDRTIKVNADVEALYDFPQATNIVVWLIENKLVGGQTIADGSRVRDYEHNHVLRTSLNSTWGELLSNSFVGEQILPYSATLQNASADWTLGNCQAVVFLIDPNSKAVYQAKVADVVVAE